MTKHLRAFASCAASLAAGAFGGCADADPDPSSNMPVTATAGMTTQMFGGATSSAAGAATAGMTAAGGTLNNTGGTTSTAGMPNPFFTPVGGMTSTGGTMAGMGGSTVMPPPPPEPSMLLIDNPVPASAAQATCNIPGVTTLDEFETIFFNEEGIPEEQRTRNCANAECHGGNYPPNLTGETVSARQAILDRENPGFGCRNVGMKLINVEQPELSLLLWRVFFPEPLVLCASKDGYEARRMPLVVGLQDSGGLESVADALSQEELDCLSWYVYEVAREANAAQ